uniref:Glutathione S-transferases-2 n=1 Tax=Dermanyssus gallinae TaxID=34641 RepID=A0A0H4FKJ9_9ACAR|nr:glutathione S-transferases-2 [Dermanyssus gallinae]
MDLYHLEASAPARACRLVAAAVGQPLNLKTVNLFEKEQLQDWFIKLNPQHTIPTLVDGDFCLAESRAIMCYLVNKCKPDSPLYPKCPQARALVDRYLYFDMGTLYKSLAEYFYPKIMSGAPLDPEKETKLKDALGFLEAFLGDNDYLVGKEVTLADIAVATSLTMTEVMNYELPAKIDAHYKRVQKFPHWAEINDKGIEAMRAFLNKNKA